MIMRVHLVISGAVQGVGFRYFVKQKADELGLTGWVRNTEEGNVEAIFKGSKENIERMIAFCKEGPPVAGVKNIETEWKEEKENFESFEIR